MRQSHRRIHVSAGRLVIMGISCVALIAGGVVATRFGSTSQSSVGSGLDVTTVWLSPRCERDTAVAMPSGGPPITSFEGLFTVETDHDAIFAMAATDAASWIAGDLQVNLTGTGATPVQILSIHAEIDSVVPPVPAWLYMPRDDCSNFLDRIFELNLDNDSVTDAGVEGYVSLAVPAPTAPLGPQFTVTAGNSKLLLFQVVSEDVPALVDLGRWRSPT